MYEWHGWATIHNTASVNYFDDDPSSLVLSGVRALLAESSGVSNQTADVRVDNGQVHVWLAGFHNHSSTAIVRLYRAIADIAPGSYGVLYTHDDDVSNCWDRWVMRRGEVHKVQDQDLSPHVGLVEDAEEV